MKNNKPIVIIGGMGPQASALLHSSIVTRSRSFHSGNPDEYPSIMHLSLQIPDFITNKQNEAKAVDIINNATAHIVPNSTSIVCIACNTAHDLKERLDITKQNFVSMIQSSITEVTNSGITCVGLMASPNTLESQLYEKPLLAAGMQVIKPTNVQLKQIESVIRSVINGSNTAADKNTLSAIAKSMQNKGANGLLLGCTELPIVGVNTTLTVVDSIDALAKNVVRQHYLV